MHPWDALWIGLTRHPSDDDDVNDVDDDDDDDDDDEDCDFVTKKSYLGRPYIHISVYLKSKEEPRGGAMIA
uniref:Uncharacterized protein n=1 Tax=Vespula pensylvanica TaxID=30213 RepID=A0A834UI20_VESPE|nr:hypothetical protein H0235_001954 [Vespula pensylvanica]